MVGAIGGEQILNMGDGCQYVGLVLHEFGHAIGYFHEHNRPDRDDNVNILWDNVQYGEKLFFYPFSKKILESKVNFLVTRRPMFCHVFPLMIYSFYLSLEYMYSEYLLFIFSE